ncbi:MAG: ABC transporter ATP-binding protein [Chloroflexi bacterium]|nr:MAG: ABC transporter ATP-binding protein [Chloroflexota bacterium]
MEALQPGGGAALRRSLGYLRAYKADAFGALVALLLVSVANLAVPKFVQIAIDDGVDRRESKAIVLAVVGLLVVSAARGLFNFLQGYLAERASQGVAYDLRNALFTKLERLSFSYFDRVQAGQLITRVTNDVEQIRAFAGAGVVQLVSALVMLTGTTVLLVLINARLAAVALLTIPAILVLLVVFIRKIGPLFGQLQQAIGRLNSVLQEDLTGMRTIRAYSGETTEAARYHRANDDLLQRNLVTIAMFSNNFPLVFLFANLGTLAVVWLGGRDVMAGNLTVGELIAFNTYLSYLLFPLLTIGFQVAGISRAGASSLRVFEILDEPLDVQDAPDAVALPPVEGRVEFTDVHFRYPGGEREVLAGVSFSVAPGQTVAVIGTTGSGKSTLVNLLPRFYDVTSGSVRIDGYDVRSVTLSSLRSQIGIALQDTLLFSGTVRENIAYGDPDATQAEIEAAARDAQAAEFIAALPQGYDTVVGERGLGLSGGQRQRIAIARVLLINPRLLILDESTSAVDTATEAAIQDALDRLMRDHRRTTFVIAQRIGTVRDADLILVLDGGQIVAQGTHAELLASSQLYVDIVRSQLREDDPAPDGRVADG